MIIVNILFKFVLFFYILTMLNVLIDSVIINLSTYLSILRIYLNIKDL